MIGAGDEAAQSELDRESVTDFRLMTGKTRLRVDLLQLPTMEQTEGLRACAKRFEC